MMLIHKRPFYKDKVWAGSVQYQKGVIKREESIGRQR